MTSLCCTVDGDDGCKQGQVERQESVTFGRQLSSVTEEKQDVKAENTLIEEEVSETGRVGFFCLRSDCLDTILLSSCLLGEIRYSVGLRSSSRGHCEYFLVGCLCSRQCFCCCFKRLVVQVE